MSARAVILLSLCALTAFFIAGWVRLEGRHGSWRWPSPFQALIGLVTNFFDTLGIGSFAPTTSVFELTHMVEDEHIPGTLNVGDTLPTVAQALVFVAAVTVDPTTLVALIAASVLGAWLGAGVVVPRRAIQVGMSVALLVAAVLFSMRNLALMPGGGEAIGLSGTRLWIGVAGNFVLGALMTLGIGLYAPCMILVALLGMSPLVAFPIMMGSCAFLMPVGSLRFIEARGYALRPALGLALGGVPGVLLAAFVVKSLPLVVLRWAVVVVVVYTAGAMLRNALRKR